ncbi:ATP-binding protein [Bacteroides sp. 519]|uniref:hybrid sensor histidine kinase/response regulator n=1 Tax=Bacteroides sp. 519 TaxID=2302937 RepID=UPI0013D5CA88|nr:ATP-binding protein [Bacteroides sp. 519]NDV59901.1 response regulator [Bacteroides sp. 519]
MSKPTRFTKFKVAIGYLVLLGIIFYSLRYIERELNNMSVVDNNQLLQTDSLLNLIRAKDENALSMLQDITIINDSMITVTEKEETIAIRDSIIELQRVQHNVVESRDSIVTTRAKKGFFKRVAEVFVPSNDTTVTVKSQVQQSTDTLLSDYKPQIAPQLVKRVTRTREDTPLKALRRGNARLRQINNVINVQIDSLINDYKEEVFLQARREAEKQQEVRLRSTKTVTAIAVGAIMLAAIFLIIIWFDLQRNARYRRELEIANKRASDLLKARENLMLTITHDFKAPLGSIIGYIDLLGDSMDANNQQQLFLSNMKSSSDHLLKLVNDLLDFHRLDLNKVQINKTTFNPAELFDEVRISFEPLTTSKGLYFKYDIDPQLNGYYNSDPLRIRQIVTNLLSNAVKFTPKGSVALTAQYQASYVTITVSDTGKGMKQEDKERIFQEFTRLPGAQGEEGFGLGLSIVHKLIYLLGGTIKVESEIGKGSSFTVRLPLETAQSKVQQKNSKQLPAEKSIQSLKVLLIDDDKLQLDMTTAMLKNKGITAVGCDQLDDLTDYLRKERFDLLLTDVQMPAMNGFDLLKLLRNSNIPQAQTIPVIAVTARSEMSGEDYCKHGFSGFLNKPFSVNDLLQVVGLGKKESNKKASRKSNKLNFEALTAFSVDDEKAGKEIIESFITETRKNTEKMWQALVAKDVNGVAAMAHKIVPLFTLVGSKDTTDILLVLEGKKDTSFTPAIKQQTEDVIQMIYSVVNQAEQYLIQLKEKGKS